MASQTVLGRRVKAIDTTVSGKLQIISGLLLGAIVIYGAVFVNTATVHNAAHDTRHSQGFPCH